MSEYEDDFEDGDAPAAAKASSSSSVSVQVVERRVAVATQVERRALASVAAQAPDDLAVDAAPPAPAASASSKSKPAEAPSAAALSPRGIRALRSAGALVERLCEENVVVAARDAQAAFLSRSQGAGAAALSLPAPSSTPVFDAVSSLSRGGKASLTPRVLPLPRDALLGCLGRRRPALQLAPSPVRLRECAIALGPMAGAASTGGGAAASSSTSGAAAGVAAEVDPLYCSASVIAIVLEEEEAGVGSVDLGGAASSGGPRATATARLLKALVCHGAITSLSYTIDGARIVAGTSDGCLHAWDLLEPSWMHKMRYDRRSGGAPVADKVLGPSTASTASPPGPSPPLTVEGGIRWPSCTTRIPSSSASSPAPLTASHANGPHAHGHGGTSATPANARQTAAAEATLYHRSASVAAIICPSASTTAGALRFAEAYLHPPPLPALEAFRFASLADGMAAVGMTRPGSTSGGKERGGKGAGGRQRAKSASAQRKSDALSVGSSGGLKASAAAVAADEAEEDAYENDFCDDDDGNDGGGEGGGAQGTGDAGALKTRFLSGLPAGAAAPVGKKAVVSTPSTPASMIPLFGAGLSTLLSGGGQAPASRGAWERGEDGSGGGALDGTSGHQHVVSVDSDGRVDVWHLQPQGGGGMSGGGSGRHASKRLPSGLTTEGASHAPPTSVEESPWLQFDSTPFLVLEPSASSRSVFSDSAAAAAKKAPVPSASSDVLLDLGRSLVSSFQLKHIASSASIVGAGVPHPPPSSTSRTLARPPPPSVVSAMQCPSDSATFLLSFTDGLVRKHNRFGDAVSAPRAFLSHAPIHAAESPAAATPTVATTCAYHPLALRYFLAGFENGDVGLFADDHAVPLKMWGCAARESPSTRADAGKLSSAASDGASAEVMASPRAVLFVAWIPSRPAAFVAVDEAGGVRVWDLLQSLVSPVHQSSKGLVQRGDKADVAAAASDSSAHVPTATAAAAGFGGGGCGPLSRLRLSLEVLWGLDGARSVLNFSPAFLLTRDREMDALAAALDLIPA